MSAKSACRVLNNGNRAWEVDECFNLGFRQGSILRVGMLNFLTYDDGEVFPGPRLNVVLGPNGTGKSTITHAICLACAGKPETLGRSNDLTQFVKHGKERMESYCEVDILTADDVYCIRRTINSVTKSSTYHLNFKKTTEKEVKSIMRSLKIDVDNLCCFMAQDKVGKFTTTTPKGIMEMTLQSITSKDDDEKTLFDVQKELTETEETKRKKHEELRGKEAAYLACVDQINSMQPEVDRARRQGESEALLKKYKVHHLVTQAQQVRQETREKERLLENAEASLQRARDLIAPLEETERELKKKVDKREKSNKGTQNRVSTCHTLMNSNKKKIDATETELEIVSANLDDIHTQRHRLLRELEKLERDHQKTKENYQKTLQRIPDMQDELQKIKASIKDFEREKEGILAQKEENTENILEQRRCEKQISKRLEGFKDPWQVYKQKLNELNSIQRGMMNSELKAMAYLETNAKTFRKDVVGPLGLHINVRDPDLARFVNNELGPNLHAFLVQTTEDEALLRKQADKIRIYTLKEVDGFDGGPYSAQVINECKDFGYVGMVRDFIECSDLVMTYLCKFHGSLLNTLYAKTLDKANFTERHSHMLCPGGRGPKVFRLLLRVGNPSQRGPKCKADFYQYSASFSMYNEAQGKTQSSKPVVIHDERNPRPQFLQGEGASVDTERERLQDELQSTVDQRKEAEAVEKQFSDRIKKVQSTIEGHKGRIKFLQDGLRAPGKDKMTLEKQTEKMAKIRKSLEKDEQKEKEKLINAYKQHVNEILQYSGEILSKAKDYANLQAEIKLENENYATLKASLDDASTKLLEAKESLKDFKATKEDAKRNFDQAKANYNEMEQKLNEYRSETYSDGAEGKAQFVREYQQIKADLPEESLEDIEVRMEELQKLIEGAVKNPQILRRFDEKLNERDVLEKEKQALQEEFRSHEANVSAQSESWLEQVENIVLKINGQFSVFMNKLGFKGGVESVRRGSMADYEMQLSVSFKETSTMSVLSGFKHSGGERAVATIMYLMALQEVSQSPFRTVDEINQGMDELNERLVIDQIVQSCTTTPNGTPRPQYFLISPKLLQGLRSLDHDDVTILMVWNGPGVDKVKWQLSDVLAAVTSKRKIQSISNPEEDEESSDNAPPTGPREVQKKKSKLSRR